MKILLPHARNAARVATKRGVVTVVGGSATVLHAGGGVIKGVW